MWKAYWGFKSDPFLDQGAGYQPLPGHEEAVARLVHAVEVGHRLAMLTAPRGLGKTRVLHRALAEMRHPSRRFALAAGPLDRDFLPARLAHALGSRSAGTTNSLGAWRALEQAVQVCALHGFHAVLAIDRGAVPAAPGEIDELQRLVHLGGDACRVTVVIAADEAWTEANSAAQAWTLAIRLRPLSCSETEAYVGAKLAAAGCHDAIFTSRAVSRLHVHSAGIPRGVDRLASLALIAGASRGMEAISSELVDSVLTECRLPPEHAFQTWLAP